VPQSQAQRQLAVLVWLCCRLGWAYFSIKVHGHWHWHQGVCFNFNLPEVCFFVLNLHQKYQGIAKGGFDLRPELHTKNVFWAPQGGLGGAAPYCTIYKNLVKVKNTKT
jgi:hypothetical protein